MSENQYFDVGADPMAGKGKFDAGGGFSYSPFYLDEAHTNMSGIWEWHNCPAFREKFDRAKEQGVFGPGDEYKDMPGSATVGKWRFTNTDDPERLTIEPSIMCRSCGFHGFLRNGRWEAV